MNSLRHVIAATLLCGACSSAMAADSPLPAGKPAGTRQAAMEGNGWVILAGLGAIAAFTAILVSQNDKNSVTSTTTSTTGTGP